MQFLKKNKRFPTPLLCLTSIVHDYLKMRGSGNFKRCMLHVFLCFFQLNAREEVVSSVHISSLCWSSYENLHQQQKGNIEHVYITNDHYLTQAVHHQRTDLHLKCVTYCHETVILLTCQTWTLVPLITSSVTTSARL